jgi:hypothetical protein
VLDFIHLSATGVAERAESTNLKGCPHTYIVYLKRGYKSIVYISQKQWEEDIHLLSIDRKYFEKYRLADVLKLMFKIP